MALERTIQQDEIKNEKRHFREEEERRYSLVGRALIKKYNEVLNKRIADISSEGISLLMDYSFPGNVR